MRNCAQQEEDEREDDYGALLGEHCLEDQRGKQLKRRDGGITVLPP